MFITYENVAAFGISATVTFFVSATVLLIYMAKKGHLRVGSRRNASPTLLPTEEPFKILVPVELMPLKTDKLPV